MARQKSIARSVVCALQDSCEDEHRSTSAKTGARLNTFFALHQIRLFRYQSEVFLDLRHSWHVDEDKYAQSFAQEANLIPQGGMGYSGSVFFTTKDGNYLVKSVPRRFEHSFFKYDFLQPYVTYMDQHIDSMLIRITDFLASERVSVGKILRLTPSHHIVMENLLTGREEAKQAGGGNWETWDLKPMSYFFPERDIAGGKLTSEATKSQLADKFDDKITLSKEQADEFFRLLDRDTHLLEQTNAVDYSLFLIRIPLSEPQGRTREPGQDANAPKRPDHPPFSPPGPPSWRTGINSADGKYVFRAAILDFFWARHKTHAKLMSCLIRSWNVFDKQGPMSITTTPKDYRQRFLQMCHDLIEVDSRSDA